MSASDALSALKAIYDVANKVKDNNQELIRLSRRIEHVVLSIEELSRDCDIIRSDQYNDALTTIFDLILRTQRVAQRLLKRNLGDRTWNASEISSELRRLNDDVQNYLSVHTLRMLDFISISNNKQQNVLSNHVEELTIKVNELSHVLQNVQENGWAPSMQSRAPPNAGKLHDVNFEKLIQSGHITLRVIGLRKHWGANDSEFLDLRLRADAGKDDIMHAIRDAGFIVPPCLDEERELRITVTEGDSVYDAAVPGGLRVNKSEPLLWWWNKYTTYHELIPDTTPGITIVHLKSSWRTRVIGVSANVLVSFHRTLRVPDAGVNNLPESLGTFPLIPIDKCHRGVPTTIQGRGGFLMPMFRREAVRLEFDNMTTGLENRGSAIKVSVGGVNVLSGISTNSIKPPKLGVKQDYIVGGQQPWLHGIVSGRGVVRQFVAAGLGSGYTVEEQITGKAEIGGFQFDIFPRRPSVDGKFFHHEEQLDSISTPSELGLIEGNQLILERRRIMVGSKWSLVDYRRRVSPNVTMQAVYDSGVKFAMLSSRHSRHNPLVNTPAALRGVLGLAVDGKIEQKIYRDKDSPRVYDEERGHRFFVHTVTPELWEAITGILPPITPITREMYTQNGVPWYKLFDDYVEGITTGPSVLSNVLSVTQLDKENSASSAGIESQLDNLIDPKAPPNCSLHPSATSSCVFRPCGHLACMSCVGSAVLAGNKCPNCQATVEKFVGMQTPLPVPQINGGAYQEGQWSAEETEELAMAAASSKAVTVIHREEDRPSPLYSSCVIHQRGDRARVSPTSHAHGRSILRESDSNDFGSSDILNPDLSTSRQSGERQSRIEATRTPDYWHQQEGPPWRHARGGTESDMKDFDLSTSGQSDERQSRIEAIRTPGYWHQQEGRPSPLNLSRAIDQSGDQASPTRHEREGTKSDMKDFDLSTSGQSDELHSTIEAIRILDYWHQQEDRPSSLT